MTIEQFIENVIRGGWTGVNTSNGERLEGEIWDYVKGVLLTTPEQFICSILLDPLAWQAVARVKIQELDGEPTVRGAREQRIKAWAAREMLAMTQALIDGHTIEEFLATV